MAQAKKLILDQIRIHSFVTTLGRDPLSRLRGGISGSDCPFSQVNGCTEDPGCTDENRCAGSGCCGPPEI